MTATAVREKPILFSGPMVKAILDGRKTQTRRVVKPQPRDNDGLNCAPRYDSDRWSFYGGGYPDHGKLVACPYGEVGSRLWVRESWCHKIEDGCIVYNADHNLDQSCCWYRADGVAVRAVDGDGFARFNKSGEEASPWVPSIHMPRWASRLTLEIIDVKVERLNQISEADALADGGWTYGTCPIHKAPQKSFAHLWDSINGKKHPWSSSPWVWAISFRKV